jgi:nitrite reductase (NO-forming)
MSTTRAIAEVNLDLPGRYLMVDHSISRAMDKGALGGLVVTGEPRPDLFKSLTPEIAKRASGH